MQTNCPNREKNREACTCTYAACNKHGLCCACVTYHRERGEIPGCFFSTQGEATWDRSVEALYRDRYKKNET